MNVSDVHSDTVNNGDTDSINEKIRMSYLTELYFEKYEDALKFFIKDEDNREEAVCDQDSNLNTKRGIEDANVVLLLSFQIHPGRGALFGYVDKPGDWL